MTTNLIATVVTMLVTNFSVEWPKRAVSNLRDTFIVPNYLGTIRLEDDTSADTRWIVESIFELKVLRVPDIKLEHELSRNLIIQRRVPQYRVTTWTNGEPKEVKVGDRVVSNYMVIDSMTVTNINHTNRISDIYTNLFENLLKEQP